MKRLLYLALLTLTFSGCKKESNPNLPDGTYVGTFSTLVDNKEKRTDFEVTLEAKRFTTTKGGAGRGSFEVVNSNQVTFVDELFYTANFDWNTILNGDYGYQIKGDSLLLNKYFLVQLKHNYYQYRLKKIK
ncbi:hypothetical protein [Pedobacter insulae]|uniref:Lipoprotein n=1 Tax=Pedobacter insulae TaxID=414048 RepID=A0A1I2UB69_9SPHI|nr:hypothetical protein [Pedobacter insulae]SFG74394.1 hypothetical protein SAMN04489864_10267 [Pedobacter insulae]